MTEFLRIYDEMEAVLEIECQLPDGNILAVFIKCTTDLLEDSHVPLL